VASPDGIEPGVLAGHSKDGKKILILPPSLLGDQTDPHQPQQQNQSYDGERIDHATLLSVRR
jgi:hypothetical protein